MMKYVLTGLLLLLPAAAAAQMPGIIQESSGTYSPAFFVPAGGHADTPTMRRQKLARAVALRSEVDGFLVTDGGVLTDEHQRYVQRKARDILGIAR
ncbi:hypothetical protein Q4F19_00820 [Sphingomonas sp. BIUV-7]|uniref:Uncharacterized protein n=1 Tax=Sphingomonas natans TaxID=3063330 RepID=A0ABT8Y3N3_9SPHN|nr:hypothetical protein [Sphingomonas sp. BIUV-7]MDO6412914.1 hypothetical protein [Sphingomonas sp. BIUV-7]